MAWWLWFSSSLSTSWFFSGFSSSMTLKKLVIGEPNQMWCSFYRNEFFIFEIRCSVWFGELPVCLYSGFKMCCSNLLVTRKLIEKGKIWKLVISENLTLRKILRGSRILTVYLLDIILKLIEIELMTPISFDPIWA